MYLRCDTGVSDAAPLAPCAPIRIPQPTSGLSPLIRWGLPLSAKRLLMHLEEFQRVVLQQQPFLLQEMPVSLTQMLQSTVSRQTQYSQGISDALREVCGPRPMTDEEKSAYFFWIEKVYEMNSGRVLFSTNQLNFFTRALFKQPHQGFVVNGGLRSSNVYPVSPQDAFGQEEGNRSDDNVNGGDAHEIESGRVQNISLGALSGKIGTVGLQKAFPVDYSGRQTTQERQLDFSLTPQQQTGNISNVWQQREGVSSRCIVHADQEAYYAGDASDNPFEQDHVSRYAQSGYVVEGRMHPFPDEERHSHHTPERHIVRYPVPCQHTPYQPLYFGEYGDGQ